MIYFDAGATTLQKPETVARAMYRAVGQLSSPGRGSYPATRAAEETDLQCRTLAARLFGVADPARVVFTSCATHGLNIAVHTLVKPGGRVIISGYEHNAVTRPLHAIPGVEITVADGPLFDGEEMVRQFAAALACPADAVICTHVSNVFGFRLPVERIAALCREEGVPFVLDASQSAGMLPVDMDARGCCCAARSRSRCCGAARGRSRSCRRCRRTCRTGWRPGRTICRGSQGCWKGCGLWSSRAWDVLQGTRDT